MSTCHSPLATSNHRLSFCFQSLFPSITWLALSHYLGKRSHVFYILQVVLLYYNGYILKQIRENMYVSKLYFLLKTGA